MKFRDLSPSAGPQTRQAGVKLLFKEKNTAPNTAAILSSFFLHFLSSYVHTSERSRDDLKRFLEKVSLVHKGLIIAHAV